MFSRLIKYSKNNSFFIFGARGTGKSTFIQNELGLATHSINLLEQTMLLRYGKNPDLLIEDIKNISPETYIVIDEVQKLPEILDVVHHLIESKKQKFILTGSSARKLKRGAANLLAGRAFQYSMFPLTSLELKEHFHLDEVLRWGSLPKVFSLTPEDKDDFLRTYAHTYLKEEILEEQLVRNTFAFRNFLEIAAQENGNVLSFSKIAHDLGIDHKTVQNFFQILEDTLVGFFLPAFHRSTRKSVKQQPKFYLFDLGVKRALDHTLNSELSHSSKAYGKAFEHFMICEVMRLNSYRKLDYQLSHFQTYSGGEIDLVLHRGREIIAIEIKSSLVVDINKLNKFRASAESIFAEKKYFISQDPHSIEIQGVKCIHWKKFLEMEW